MATESNQQAGATGPAAPPATPTRNRHSAGIQVGSFGLHAPLPAWQVRVLDAVVASRRSGKMRYDLCNELLPMYGALQVQVLEVSQSGAAIRTFQETLQTALVYGTAGMVLVPPRPWWLRQPILTVKGDDGVTWDWRGMREAR